MPPGAVLEALRIGNVAQPIRQEGANVAVPITPGAQQVQLVWREPRGFEPRYQASRVDLHLADGPPDAGALGEPRFNVRFAGAVGGFVRGKSGESRPTQRPRTTFAGSAGSGPRASGSQ